MMYTIMFIVGESPLGCTAVSQTIMVLGGKPIQIERHFYGKTMWPLLPSKLPPSIQIKFDAGFTRSRLEILLLYFHTMSKSIDCVLAMEWIRDSWNKLWSESLQTSTPVKKYLKRCRRYHYSLVQPVLLTMLVL